MGALVVYLSPLNWLTVDWNPDPMDELDLAFHGLDGDAVSVLQLALDMGMYQPSGSANWEGNSDATLIELWLPVELVTGTYYQKWPKNGGPIRVLPL